MCDFTAGRLIVAAPSRGYNEEPSAIQSIRSGAIENCSVVESIIERLETVNISTEPARLMPLRYYLLAVPPGEEIYIANQLVHEFNGNNPRFGDAVLAFAQPDYLLSLTQSASPHALDIDPDVNRHDCYKQLLNVSSAHSAGHRGQGVTIAVLDTGLAHSSRAFSQVDTQQSYDFVNHTTVGCPDEDNGHGSAVTWLIHELAPDAELHIIKVANQNGCAGEWDVLAGINSAYAIGTDIVNLSLQLGLATTASPPCGRDSESSKSMAFERQLQMIHDASRTGGRPPAPLYIAATGNQGATLPTYPARFQQVVAVGSVNSNLNRSSFSNYGVPHNQFFMAPGGDRVDTKVPPSVDESVGSTVNGKLKHFGTSMACAYASGLFAIYKSIPTWRSYSASQFMQEISQRTNRQPTHNPLEYGSGLLQYAYP